MRHTGRLTMAIIGFIALIAFPVHSSLGRQNQDRQDAHESHEAHLRPRSIRNLNSGFLPTVPADLPSWQSRAKTLRQQLRLALGLIPPPPRAPLEPVIHGKILLEGYSVEKVYFESAFGFLVTGNLYRPLEATTNPNGLYPGVLCPHGHHANGRFLTSSDADVRSQIEKGAEEFESNARSILQARCGNLAKMGCVVFHYDMIGYADSQQIPYSVAHGFRKLRPTKNDTSKVWRFYSPIAESLSQNIMGLQTWNSIRALDFLSGLPDVDPSRIGVTGASGGGTQTFILCALDDRPKVAFPAVMVSTGMQGGCTCENCAYLRIGAGNVDFAALFAPKPMGLTAANDWTRDMKTKGFPELENVYKLFSITKSKNGSGELPGKRLQLTSRLEFGHNYNQVSRQAMYRLFARELGLNPSYIEQEIAFVPPDQLSVFDSAHPAPPRGFEFETDMLKKWEQHIVRSQQIDWEQDGMEPVQKLRLQLAPFHDFLSRQLAAIQENPSVLKSAHKSVYQFRHRSVTVVEHPPKQSPQESSATLLLLGNSETEIRLKNSNLVTIEQRFSSGQPTRSLPFANGREALGYTMGYNLPPVVTHFYWLRKVIENQENKNVVLCGLGKPGVPLTAQAPHLTEMKTVRGFVIDTQGFRFRNVQKISDWRLLPAASRFRDVEGLLSAIAPKPLLLFGETKSSVPLLVKTYQKYDAQDQLVLDPGPANEAMIEEFLNQHFRTAD